MKITTTLTKTYTYHFNGVDKYLHEIKNRILDNVCGILECNVDSNIETVNNKYVIDIITPDEIPFMALSDITDLIPRWYEEFEKKEKQGLQADKEFYLDWKENVMIPLMTYDKPAMNKFVQNILCTYKDAVRCAKEGKWDTARLNANDFDDLMHVLAHIEHSNYKAALADYRALDTAVRDYVPGAIVRMICPK